MAWGHPEYSASYNWAHTCGDSATHAYGTIMRYWLPWDLTRKTKALKSALCGSGFLASEPSSGVGWESKIPLFCKDSCSAAVSAFLDLSKWIWCRVWPGVVLWVLLLSDLDKYHGRVCRKPCDMPWHLCNQEWSAFLSPHLNFCCHNTCRPSMMDHVLLSTPS